MINFWAKTTQALAFTMTLAFLSTEVQADSGPVVVELFTSQGCSSCPPADALLEQLAGRRDVIALGLHVDYWDYIGWADVFAKPEYTKRQRKYASAAGKSMIYTPQMVIGGVDHVIGNKPADVETSIKKHTNAASPVNIKVSRRDETYVVQATSDQKKDMVIHLVRFSPMKTVSIHRGENAGRKISYANIVSDWRELKKWNGASAATVKVKASSEPFAIIIQSKNHGRILAAARLD